MRAGIVTGAGDKAFCAGFDITEKNVDGRPTTEDFTPRPGTSPVTGKPLIAAVNGLAMAAGMALVEACDLCVAADHAWFSLPEVRLGIGLEPFVAVDVDAAAEGAVRAAGHRGPALTAERAYQIGFVNRIAPGRRADGHRAHAGRHHRRQRAAGGRASQGADLRRPAGDGNGQRPDRREPAFAPVSGSEDAKEGYRAWMEKRPPAWRSE